MGTSTLFKRFNDLSSKLSSLSKEELKEIDELSPYGEQKERVRGWSIEMELHNGNFEPLIWWYGRLMRLRDASKLLAKKHYDTYRGKQLQISEWKLMKGVLEKELKRYDKEFEKQRAGEYRQRDKK
jgi:hypothetical protein